MIYCTKCEQQNNDSDEFCHQCRHPLKAVNWCSSCQTDNPFGLEECFKCAALLDGETAVLGSIVPDDQLVESDQIQEEDSALEASLDEDLFAEGDSWLDELSEEPTSTVEDLVVDDDWMDQFGEGATPPEAGLDEDLFAEGDSWLDELSEEPTSTVEDSVVGDDWMDQFGGGNAPPEAGLDEDLFAEGDSWLDELSEESVDAADHMDSFAEEDWLDQLDDEPDLTSEPEVDELAIPDWMSVVDEESEEEKAEPVLDEETGLVMEDLSNVRATTMDTSILKDDWSLEEESLEDYSSGYGDLLGDDEWLSEQLDEIETDGSDFDDDDEFVIEHTGWLTGRLGTGDLEEDYFGDGDLEDLVQELGTDEIIASQSFEEEFGLEMGEEFFAEEEEDVAYSPGTGPLPDWLVELKTGPLPLLDDNLLEGDGYSGTDDLSLPETGDLPDWMIEMDTSSLPPLSSDDKKGDGGQPASNDLAWLDDISAEAAGSPDGLDLMGDDLMPDWLADAMPSASDSSDLMGDDPLANLVDEPVEEGDLSDIGFDKQEDLPDWLNSGDQFDFESALDAALAVQEQEDDDSWGDDWTDLPDPAEIGEIDLDQGTLPDWLEAVRPDGVDLDEEERFEDLDFSEEEEELGMPTMISESDIPEWISALKPRALTGEPEPEPEPEPVEEIGPLAGLSGVLQIASAVTMDRAMAGKTAVGLTHDSTAQVSMLQQLAQEHERQGYTIAKRVPHQVSPLFRLSITALLFGLIVALWWDVYPINFAWGAAAPELTKMKVALDELSGETVLVAFDYTPAFGGELDLTAELILHQLEENGNQIVPVSRYATGVGNAERLIQLHRYQNISDPLLIVGNGVGLRQFSTCFETVDCFWSFGNMTEEEEEALANLSMIIVLTSDRDVVVDWVEQVGTGTELPIYMGVTEALAPIVSPYLASEQIEGALSGINGLINYDPTPTRKLLVRANIQAVLQWFLILFLPTSNLITLFLANWQKSKKKKIRKIPQASNPWRMANQQAVVEEEEDSDEIFDDLIYDDQSQELDQ